MRHRRVGRTMMMMMRERERERTQSDTNRISLSGQASIELD